MITDNKTNFVYFSALLPQRHPKFFKELRVILERKRIKCGLLPDTNDIWCRDYMPIQIAENSFVQFKYYPKYLLALKKDRATITDVSKTCEAVRIKHMISDIKIDGGNIVRSKTKVIMTKRILSENPHYQEKKLISRLKILLKAKQIILIPECPGDPFGHADGMIRFVDGVKDEKTVLVNDFSREPVKFFTEFHRVLSEYGLLPILLPYTAYRNKGDDAEGIYINYLQVGKIVAYPTYGLKEDALAHKVFTRYFGANVVPIRANSIAKEGGVLNCISWNIVLAKRSDLYLY